MDQIFVLFVVALCASTVRGALDETVERQQTAYTITQKDDTRVARGEWTVYVTIRNELPELEDLPSRMATQAETLLAFVRAFSCVLLQWTVDGKDVAALICTVEALCSAANGHNNKRKSVIHA